MFLCKSLCGHMLLFLLGKYLRVERAAESCNRYIFNFRRNHNFSKVVVLFYFTFAPPVYECSSCSISSPALGVWYLNFRYFHFRYDFNLSFLMTKDFKHLFMCLCTIHLSSLVPVQIFCTLFLSCLYSY